MRAKGKHFYQFSTHSNILIMLNITIFFFALFSIVGESSRFQGNIQAKGDENSLNILC
jgi:hypothetical protein